MDGESDFYRNESGISGFLTASDVSSTQKRFDSAVRHFYEEFAQPNSKEQVGLELPLSVDEVWLNYSNNGSNNVSVIET